MKSGLLIARYFTGRSLFCYAQAIVRREFIAAFNNLFKKPLDRLLLPETIIGFISGIWQNTEESRRTFGGYTRRRQDETQEGDNFCDDPGSTRQEETAAPTTASSAEASDPGADQNETGNSAVADCSLKIL